VVCRCGFADLGYFDTGSAQLMAICHNRTMTEMDAHSARVGMKVLR
jgi:hypothetical protein